MSTGRNITNMHKRFLVEYIYYMIWKKLHSVNFCKNALTVGGNDKYDMSNTYTSVTY